MIHETTLMLVVTKGVAEAPAPAVAPAAAAPAAAAAASAGPSWGSLAVHALVGGAAGVAHALQVRVVAACTSVVSDGGRGSLPAQLVCYIPLFRAKPTAAPA